MRHVFATLFGLLLCFTFTTTAVASSFICAEPGGKRLIHILDNAISRVSDDEIVLRINGKDILADGKIVFVVDDKDVRHSPGGVKIATFDGRDIRHAAGGKVMIHYAHPDLCPTSADNRIYSIEGDALNNQQLVAGLYLLKPEMFQLSEEETAAQQKAIKEAGEESDRAAAADPVAGITFNILNSSGIMDKVGAGSIVVGAKKGDAYPVTFDFTKGGGPTWTGAGLLAAERGDKVFYVAYGTPKSIALCAYDIEGPNLSGTWYPWCVDGTPKSLGTENLRGPKKLSGTYTITAAKAPFSGTAYTGSVAITPLKIVGASDDAQPVSLIWTIGGAKAGGIGIHVGNRLYVASGTGADICIARFKIQNGTMTSDWFKVGSMELGGSAATN